MKCVIVDGQCKLSDCLQLGSYPSNMTPPQVELHFEKGPFLRVKILQKMTQTPECLRK